MLNFIASIGLAIASFFGVYHPPVVDMSPIVHKQRIETVVEAPKPKSITKPTIKGVTAPVVKISEPVVEYSDAQQQIEIDNNSIKNTIQDSKLNDLDNRVSNVENRVDEVETIVNTPEPIPTPALEPTPLPNPNDLIYDHYTYTFSPNPVVFEGSGAVLTVNVFSKSGKLLVGEGITISQYKASCFDFPAGMEYSRMNDKTLITNTDANGKVQFNFSAPHYMNNFIAFELSSGPRTCLAIPTVHNGKIWNALPGEGGYFTDL